MNVINVGGNILSDYTGSGTSGMAGTGVFNQTGGSVGSLDPSGNGANNCVGLMVGGNWSGTPYSYGTAAAGPVFNASSSGTYTLGNANGTVRRSWSAAAR